MPHEKVNHRTPRQLSLMVLDWALRTARLLAQADTRINMSESGSHRSLRPLLETLVALVERHFFNFPLEEGAALPSEEVDLLLQIGNSLSDLEPRVWEGGNNRGLGIASALKTQSMALSSGPLMAERAKKYSERLLGLIRPVEHCDTLFSKIEALSSAPAEG